MGHSEAIDEDSRKPAFTVLFGVYPRQAFMLKPSEE